MRLKRNGFVMRVAYGDKDTLPSSHVNICPTFWRFVRGILFLIPRFMVDFILLASRPPIFKKDWVNGVRLARHFEYSWWPKGKGFRWGRHDDPVPPILFILLFGLVTSALVLVSSLAILLWIAIAPAIKSPTETFSPLIKSVWSTRSMVILLSLVAMFLLIELSNRIWNSEPILLGRAFLRSKKEKLCFTVEVTKD